MLLKTYIINLDKNPERLSFMEGQFTKMGMDFERFVAIDGSKYDFSTYYQKVLSSGDNNGVKQPLGILGCALSHKKAMELVIESGHDFGLILEDDVELRSDFKEIINREITERQSGKVAWDYLSFNYPTPGWKSIVLWLFLFQRHFLKHSKSLLMWIKLPLYLIKFVAVSSVYLFEGFRNKLFILLKIGKPVRVRRDLYLAGCYLVTREGAKKLIKLNKELMYTADELPNEARKLEQLKFYAYVPHIARQKRESFPSILTEGQDFGNKVISY